MAKNELDIFLNTVGKRTTFNISKNRLESINRRPLNCETEQILTNGDLHVIKDGMNKTWSPLSIETLTVENKGNYGYFDTWLG